MSAPRSDENDQKWKCPDCGWEQAAHPTYGWATHNARAVEVHQTALCPWRSIEPCSLGYQEHDGARYCFEHGGFLEPGLSTRRCDRAQVIPPGSTAPADGA